MSEQQKQEAEEITQKEFSDVRGSDGRPPRNYDPLPTSPPYTAFLGNLSYGVTESEVAAFFDGYETKSIKIVRDRDGRSKGFGYIEFTALDSLKDALERSGESFAGRTVRASVARPPKGRPGKP